MYSLSSNAVSKNPHAANESGDWGSSSVRARRALDWPMGMNSDPAGTVRRSACHAPSKVSAVCPSNVVFE